MDGFSTQPVNASQPCVIQTASPASTCPKSALGKPLTSTQVSLLALASGMSVANIYFAQPLLPEFSAAFAVTSAQVGQLISMAQLGSVLALIFLLPLGDRMDRRCLLLMQALALVVMLVLLGIAPSLGWAYTAMLGVGLLATAMTQGLIAYAASVAHPAEQGQVLAKVQAGVFLGLLLARVVAGGLSDIAGWRMVYLSSAACMLLVVFLLWRSLARANASTADNISQVTGSYPRFIGSMLALLWRHRLLQVRGMLALLMFAVFNIFWSALSLALSAPPYAYSNTAIGALGLVGAIGALTATQAGRWLDKGAHQQVTLIALLLLAIAWWPLAFMSWSLAALMLGIILLDMGGQALHVSNQSLLLRSNAEQQQGSIIGMYMLFYALGSGLGAAAGTAVFAHDGWQGVCLLGFSLSALALVFWLATRRALS